MPDLTALETRLSSDKGYTGESPAKDGLPGFVCPRADTYGGRDGIIPPGVAAVRGLVPRGMRRISKADVARTADEARDSGKSEAEQYREYYGRGAKELQGQLVQPVQHMQPAQPVQPVQVKTAEQPSQQAQQASLPVTPPPPLPPPPPAPVSQVIRDPDDPGMFSKHTGDSGYADTLDGFYDELGRSNSGTAAAEGEAAPAVQRSAGSVASEPTGTAGTAETGTPSSGGSGGSGGSAGRAAPVPPAPRAYGPSSSGPMPPDAMGAALASMVAERDRLYDTATSLQAQVDELKRQLAGYEARDAHYANIERELRQSRGEPEAETVRAILSAPEERLKVGGRGWECNVMGALHYGRGRSLILTMADPAYASELFTEIQAGEVVVLSASGRMSCTYSGRCVKIYGDAGSPDFIAMLWLDVAPARSVE